MFPKGEKSSMCVIIGLMPLSPDESSLSYAPGWDCHGLPIEGKAMKDMNVIHNLLTPLFF